MKEISKLLISLAVAFGITSVLNAQTVDSDGYLITSYNGNISLGTRKYVTSASPDVNGEYTLRIENFLMKDLQFVPTDIVLVIDGSGSMLYDYIGNVTATDMTDGQVKPINECKAISIEEGDAKLQGTGDDPWPYCAYSRMYKTVLNGENGTTAESYSDDPTGAYKGQGRAWIDTFQNESASTPSELTRFYRYHWPDHQTYKKYSGYYKIYHEEDSDGKYLYIWRKDDSNGFTAKRYLWQTDVSSTKKGVKHDDSIIYTQTSHIRRPKLRKAVLVEGVKAFLHQVAELNAMDSHWASGVTRNQVAMVGFSYGWNGTLSQYSGAPSNSTKVMKSFAVVNSSLESQFENIYNGTMEFTGNTYTHDGVYVAQLLLEDLQNRAGMAPITSTGAVNRDKLVVVFTDGDPNITDSYTTDFYEAVYAALNYGVEIKKTGWNSSTDKPEVNGKIFTVDIANTPSARIFLQHLSSDYPEGRATITSGAPDADPLHYSGNQETVDVYYKDATGHDLVTIFREIVAASVGSVANQTLSVVLTAVDKIASSFLLPDGLATSGKVKLYTAQYLGKSNGHLTFASDVAAPTRSSVTLYDVGIDGMQTSETVDIDNGISYSIPDSRTITFTGFDYNKLWCGDDPFYGGTRGYKMIAEFPIVPASNIVGGYQVNTNEASSGLYQASDVSASGALTGSPLAPYVSPSLSIPVLLVIQKTGLKPGESASFTIQRKSATSGGATYVDFASFILTGDFEDTPEVRLVNLDPTYHYRIKETGWSWSYSSDAMTDFPSTEDQTLTNPIVISNSPLAIPVNRAEAKATNVLKTN